MAFLPAQCALIQELYPQIEFVVEPSSHRCVPDDQYQKLGISVSEDLSRCSVLFGIKEVPPQDLWPSKTYFIFSHTIKQQIHNRKLLQAALEKKVCLIDYECITDEHKHRTVAFGRFAGIVGAYNAFRMWFKRFREIELPAASKCRDMAEMLDHARRNLSQLSPIRIGITGSGRVGRGAVEVLRNLGIKEVSEEEFLNETPTEPVFFVISSRHYIRNRTTGRWDEGHFRKFPEEYNSDFSRFCKKMDVLIACAFWDPRAPRLFEKSEVSDPNFVVRIISDVTCDLDGSIPTTLRASTIEEPFYDVQPTTMQEQKAFSDPENITVSAVDNLPTELPYDASQSFGEMLTKHIIPELAAGGGRSMHDATITKEGKLMPAFAYLESYALEKA